MNSDQLDNNPYDDAYFEALRIMNEEDMIVRMPPKKEYTVSISRREVPGKVSVELLSHFNCQYCRKWWSVSEAPPNKTVWYCTWCGRENHIDQMVLSPKWAEAAREAFARHYGEIGESLDEDTWILWLGIWYSAWSEASHSKEDTSND